MAIGVAIVAVGIAASGGIDFETTQPATTAQDAESASFSSSQLASGVTVSGEVQSIIDPGVGHESHSLAILLPPSEKVYSGTLTYRASEPIQLVSLDGPLGPGEDKGQPIWTPDGKTKFALTFVDDKKSSGKWQFSGNALAVHTMNTDGFSVSYSIDYSISSKKTVAPKPMTEPEPEPMAEPEPEPMAAPEPEPMAAPEPEPMAGPQTMMVSLPKDSAAPGCETTDACYIPSMVSINVGDTVSWSNDDTAAHTVTSGTPQGGPDGVFDSSLFMAGTTFDVTFDSSGNYDYFCMVHPWMAGKVTVN